MEFEPSINDLLDPRIKNFEDLQNHFDLVKRLQKSFYFVTPEDDQMITNGSLPLTTIAVDLFEKAIEELKCNARDGPKKIGKFSLKYATRLSRKAAISPYCFILALIYIKRLSSINPAYVKSQSACDLFLISLLVSSKFLYEESTEEEIFNFEWAQIAGIPVQALNQMEIEFLFKLDWRAHVSPREFVEEWLNIENLVIRNECRKRSFRFLTYNEITRIFENDKIYQRLVSNVLTFVSKFILVASFTYSSVVLGLILLSKSTMLQNGLMVHSQHVVNQSYLGDGYAASSSSENGGNAEHGETEPEDQIDDQSLEELNESLNNLDLKALNLNKLNGLNLNELNNRLNFLSRQQSAREASVELKDLSNEISNIAKQKHGQMANGRCGFSQFTELIRNLPATYTSENHSGYHLPKERSPVQPTIRKLFLDYRVF